MKLLLKLAWVEGKLLLREPTTLVFTFAFPFVLLFVMGGVFGDTPDPEGVIYRGVGPMTFYVPAYIGLVLCSIGTVALPLHITGYRERGVLRRLRASSLSVWTFIGAQLLVSLAIALVGGVLMVIVGLAVYGAMGPVSLVGVMGAFLLGVLCFAAFGMLLGAVLPTARSAQSLGLILFLVMMLLAGAGPPREVMSDAMRWVADATPLRYVIQVLQDPWLGLGWETTASLITGGITTGCALLTARFFRWE